MRRMPRTLLSSISILAAAFLVARCSSSTSPSSPGSCGTVSTAHGTISGQLDGAAWSGTVTALLNASLHEVSITGTDGCSPAHSITFALLPGGLNGPLQTGTFNVNDATGLNSILSIGPINLFVANVTGGSGKVTFTTLTTTAAVGTFQFSYVPSAASGASGTHTVTNGVFNVTF
jgi:hypothetical protein